MVLKTYPAPAHANVLSKKRFLYEQHEHTFCLRVRARCHMRVPAFTCTSTEKDNKNTHFVGTYMYMYMWLFLLCIKEPMFPIFGEKLQIHSVEGSATREYYRQNAKDKSEYLNSCASVGADE